MSSGLSRQYKRWLKRIVAKKEAAFKKADAIKKRKQTKSVNSDKA